MIVLETLAERGILFPGDAAATDAARTGGKAAGLSRLRDAGCDVPPWFVVTPDYDIDAGRDALHEALARLTADDPHCHNGDECPDIALRDDQAECHPDVLSGAAELVEGCATTFAVRSSAVVEDGANASYAGQFTSLLFVPHDGVLDAIHRVRASAANANARVYDAARAGSRTATSDGRLAMPVVVQRMVDGDASGVAFGIDPVDGSDVVVVAAAYGLASGIVDGDCTTDAWRVARDGTIVSRTIVEKDRMHVRAPGAGTLPVTVDAALRSRPALDDVRVRAVASLARRIANATGAPQDVEFTFAGGRLWALQARPVTAVARAEAPVAIWDDSNIAESYGGVVGALTYSFARDAYAGAYRAFFRLAGVPRDTHRRERAHVRGARRPHRRPHDVRPRRLVPHAVTAARLPAQPPPDGRDDGRARGAARGPGRCDRARLPARAGGRCAHAGAHRRVADGHGRAIAARRRALSCARRCDAG